MLHTPKISPAARFTLTNAQSTQNPGLSIRRYFRKFPAPRLISEKSQKTPPPPTPPPSPSTGILEILYLEPNFFRRRSGGNFMLILPLFMTESQFLHLNCYKYIWNHRRRRPEGKFGKISIRFELIRSDRSNFQVLNGTHFVTYIRLELISQNPPLGGLISEKSWDTPPPPTPPPNFRHELTLAREIFGNNVVWFHSVRQLNKYQHPLWI